MSQVQAFKRGLTSIANLLKGSAGGPLCMQSQAPALGDASLFRPPREVPGRKADDLAGLGEVEDGARRVAESQLTGSGG